MFSCNAAQAWAGGAVQSWHCRLLGETQSDQKTAAWYFPDSGVAPQQQIKCHSFSLGFVLCNLIDVVKPVPPCDDLWVDAHFMML